MKPAISSKNQNLLLTLISILFLLLSLFLGLKLVFERQLINKRAATAAGTIYMSLAGDTSVQVGQTLPVPIRFQSVSTPDNKGISALYLTLKYPNTTAFDQPTIQEGLASPWQYTFKQVTQGASETTIYIEAGYNLVGSDGYTPTANETFATLNFRAVALGTLTLSLDSNLNVSQAISKSTIVDILNSSLAAATYTVVGAPTVTLTPSPTQPGPTATTTPTPIPGATNTPTPTPVPGATNTPGPAEPNNCGGTCGSNYNCKGGLACLGGYCRNPLDPQSLDCTVRPATPTLTPRRSGGARAAATPTPIAGAVATPTPFLFDPTPTPELGLLPTVEPTPPSTTSGQPIFVRFLIVGGMWLLVVLLIIWLIKKYRDSQVKEQKIDDLVNRFKTSEPAKPPTVTPPTPPAPPTTP